MVKTNTRIINKLGLHARAASKFANAANRFSSNIEVFCRDKVINGKSIMSLMLLAASQGTDLTITVEGADENEALAALITLIDNKFDEGE